MNKFLTLEYIRITDEGNTMAAVAICSWNISVYSLMCVLD